MIYLGLALIAVGLYFYLQRRSAAAPRTQAPSATLQDYFDALSAIKAQGRSDGGFATLTAADDLHFIQTSVGQDATGQWGYMFDIPVMDWSAPYLPAIRKEAARRGLEGFEASDTPDIASFDVNFTDRTAHDDFATWVIHHVYKIPEGTRFFLTTG